MSQRILVIDDEASIQRSLRIALEEAGFDVLLAADGQQGIDVFTQQSPALVLLDLGLPVLTGLQVLQRIRAQSQTPVIVLSVRDQERQKVEALDLGANDYLSKPFGVQELLARIRAALRNVQASDSAGIFERHPNLRVDRSSHQVWKQGELVKLTRTEFKLLELLIRHVGHVLTHRQILEEIWGEAYLSENHYLQVYISRLRRKLEADPTQPELLLTEPGIGYRLAD